MAAIMNVLMDSAGREVELLSHDINRPTELQNRYAELKAKRKLFGGWWGWGESNSRPTV